MIFRQNKWVKDIHQNTFDVIDPLFFKNYKFWTIVNYLFELTMVVLSVAFLGSDIYTAVKLLAFNQWSSEIQPFISFKVCRWIFVGCIILSIVLLLIEWVKAIIVYRTRNISLCYMNSKARALYSMQKYSYFCVFFRISSGSFFNFMAFFTNFALQGSVRLVLVDSPRQVINGITIFKLLRFNSSMLYTIRTIAATNRTEAIVLSFMTFSFVVWFLFIARLFIALILYFPVYYKIKYELQYKSGLKQFCCVTIDRRVSEFVLRRHKKTLNDIKMENLQMNLKPNFPDIDSDDDEEKSPFVREYALERRTNPLDDYELPRPNKAYAMGRDSVKNPFQIESTSLFAPSHETLVRPGYTASRGDLINEPYESYIPQRNESLKDDSSLSSVEDRTLSGDDSLLKNKTHK